MNKLKHYLVPLLIIVVAAVFFVLLNFSEEPQPEPEVAKVPLVKVHRIEKSDVAMGFRSYGRINAKEHTRLVGEVQGKIDFISDNFNSGSIVKKGELLIKIDDADYQVAVLRAEASLVQAKAEYQIVLAQSLVASKEWEGIKGGTAPPLALYEPQLKRELARVKANEAELQQAKRDLRKTQIYAPFNAVIEERIVGFGQFVAHGDEIGSLMSTDIAELRLAVSNTDMRRSGDLLGKTVYLTRKGDSEIRTAVIRRIESIIKKAEEVNYVVAEISDPLALKTSGFVSIKLGEFVSAWIETEVTAERIRIPSALVKNNHVWIMDESSKLRKKAVELHQIIDGWGIIRSGVEEGEKIVITRMVNAVEGMEVQELTGSSPGTLLTMNKGDH
jgi:RND family efflux transporter MFP subunit